MFGYATFFWPVIVGICLYAALVHLQIGLRRPIDRVHTLFGLLAFCVGIGVVSNIELATARSPAEYQAAAWFNSIAATGVFVLLPWFVTYYADEPKRHYALALSTFFAIVLIGNFFHPYSMRLSAPPELQTVTLPWGETLTRTSTPSTTWMNLVWIGYGLTIVYFVVACTSLFKRGPRTRAWGLLLSTGPFAVSLIVNILVRLELVNLPYMAAPGFLAMVLVMSVALTREWRHAHHRMQTVLDNVPAMVYLKRADGRYLLVNRHFEQFHNLSATQVVGKTDRELFDPERAAQYMDADRRALTTNGSIETEEVVEHHGQHHVYAVKRFALRDGAQPFAVCGIATDVTERKRAANALREFAHSLERRVARRTAELLHLNRELEAFAYSVSHDLRAPLTAVNGFAELLIREHGSRLDPQGQRYLQRIRDGALRMAGLIQDLLGLSRVTQHSIERVPTDLAPLAETALRTLREAEPTRTVDVQVAPTLPAHGDPKLLALLINNLLGNAWKYTAKTPGAKIEVGSREEHGEVVYFVKDNGAGFDPGQADRLFRPFVRLHSEAEFSGTGIGLATAARIVAKHGGRIWAEGQPNAGATFYFTLPPSEDEALATTTVTPFESLPGESGGRRSPC